MKELIFDKKVYLTYKDFYEDLFKKLEGSTIPDWIDFPNLNYSADDLSEFLWYCLDDGNKYIFKNFNLDKIENYKNYDNYQWFLIFKVFKRFIEKYPNNTLEFINDEE